MRDQRSDGLREGSEPGGVVGVVYDYENRIMRPDCAVTGYRLQHF